MTIVYPDSAPEDWFSILSGLKVDAFVSPLHDRDINPGGEPKKPHWHVLVMFDSVKTFEQAQELFSKINGVGCEKVNSVRGSARYLCHLDNPEKAQYSTKDVRPFGGADYHDICSLSSDRYAAISEMLEFCEDNDMVSFADLLLYCSRNRYDWFRVLCDGGGILVKEFLKSKVWARTNGKNNLST